jgi:hypothetical protein
MSSTGPFYPGNTIPKDPDADLPYDFDWSEWLGADATIATEYVVAATGLTVESSTIVDDTKVRVRLTGGTAGTSYSLRCRVTTNETPPRIDDRTVNIRVKER